MSNFQAEPLSSEIRPENSDDDTTTAVATYASLANRFLTSASWMRKVFSSFVSWIDKNAVLIQTISLIIQTVFIVWGVAFTIAQLRLASEQSAQAAVQSKKLKESVDLSTWSSVSAELIEVDKQLISDSDMIPYIYRSMPISKSDDKYDKVYATASLVIDLMDHSIAMGEHIDNSIFEKTSWEDYYKWQFQHSPIICSVIRQEGNIYGQKIAEKGRYYCDQLDIAPLSAKTETAHYRMRAP